MITDKVLRIDIRWATALWRPADALADVPGKAVQGFFEKLKCPHYLRISPAGAYPPCDSRYVLGTVLVKSDRSFGEGRGKGFPPSSEVSAN